MGENAEAVGGRGAGGGLRGTLGRPCPGPGPCPGPQ